MDGFQEREGVWVGCLVNYFKVVVVYLVIILFFVLSDRREWGGGETGGCFEAIRDSLMFTNPAVKTSASFPDVASFAGST